MSSLPSSNNAQFQNLPVIIVGAGPCGLVAALTIHQHNLKAQGNDRRQSFVVLERASPSKLRSNVGSGYDMAPTAITILRDRLGLKIGDSLHKYAGMLFCDQNANTIRGIEFGSSYESYLADRSAMQGMLLDSLFDHDDWEHAVSNVEKSKTTSGFRTSDGNGLLRCGVTVTGYEVSKEKDSVTVDLDDGTRITGSVLFGCDGIRSKVRRAITEKSGNDKDEFHFCNTSCWWGKVDVEKGSEIEKLVEKTQHYPPNKGASFVWALGTKRRPGAFMGAPRGLGTANAVYLWSFFLHADAPPTKKHTNDLTRRGGSVLTDEDKADLMRTLDGYGSLVTDLIDATPASAITNVGLWDRENLNLPYSSPDGLVALLGDAAHPQSPFAGQGVNMAVTDAYVLASRLVSTFGGPRQAAVRAYASDARRSGVNKVVEAARSRTDLSLSTSGFVNWSFRVFAKLAPTSMLLKDVEVYDQSNAEFLSQLDADLTFSP